MSREILEAMTALAREKGISPEKLMTALEDALLSSYKKLPGAARYARVEVDPETGDFVVIRYRIPKDLETELPRGIVLACTLKREDARDALICGPGCNVPQPGDAFSPLPAGFHSAPSWQAPESAQRRACGAPPP